MDVSIVGAGYAGRIAAVRMRRAGLSVTLVNASRTWIERTRLHQAAATGRAVAFPLDTLASRIGARLVVGTVVGVAEGGLVLDDGRQIESDRIVVTPGSVPAGGPPGVDEHALSLTGVDQAARIQRRLSALGPSGTVAVVGAGLTGLELATEIAESHPGASVELVGDPSRDLAPGARAALRRTLERLGVRVVAGPVTAVEPDGIVLDGRLRPAGLVLWAGGFRAPGWLEAAGLPVAADGRIRVGPTLQVEGHHRWFAAGDCASTPLRMACATAMPQGCHVAANVVRAIRDRPLRDLRFRYLLRCISLGRRAGLVQGTRPDDRPAPWWIGGRTGALAKEAILRMAAHTPDLESVARMPLFDWPRRPLAELRGAA